MPTTNLKPKPSPTPSLPHLLSPTPARARLALVGMALITLLAIFFSRNLDFDYNYERFFPKNDPHFDYYQNFRQQFENDNDFVLIGIHHGQNIYNHTFLTKIDTLTKRLSRIPHVKRVVSPTNIQYPIITPFGPMMLPYLHPHQPEKYPSDSLRITQVPGLVGTVVSSDAQSIAILIAHQDSLLKGPMDSFAIALQETVYSMDLEEVHIAGKATGQQVYIEKIKWEFLLFLCLSAILVLVLLFIAFRTWWNILIPLVVVLVAVIWVIGMLGLLDKPLDMMTTLLPTILFVVGMSDVVHIVSKYVDERRLGHDKLTAVQTTIREVGLATLLTSITTAIGFGTLIVANIEPVRNFGIYTAIGVMLAFVVAFILLPSVLILLKSPIPLEKTKRSYWDSSLRWVFRTVLRQPKRIVGISVGLMALSLVGISLIKINIRLLEDLKPSEPLAKAFHFFETEFDGVRPFEMAVTLRDTTKQMMDLEVLQEIDKVETFLKTNRNTKFLLSPVAIAKEMNKAQHGGKPEFYRLPNTPTEETAMNTLLQKLQKMQRFHAFVSTDGRMARISGKMTDLGSYAMAPKNAQLDSFLTHHIDPNLVTFQITGSSSLLERNNDYMVNNVMGGLALALLLIGLTMGLIFRSGKMLLIAIITNIFPLVLIGGIMGFAGIDLKVSTSIIFSIAFGIAVDDTIHFLSKYRLELRKGRSTLYGLKRSILGTGKAIILTSFIICGGFITLAFSSFESTMFIGILISLTLLFALLTDIFLLPALILLFLKKE